MIPNLLQMPIMDTSAITETADTLNMHHQIKLFAEKIATTSPTELLAEFVEKLMSMGEKIVIALIVFVVGYYFIKMVKLILTRNMTRHKADLSVQSFVVSLVKSILMVILLMSCANILGVSSVNIAAIIAASGVAIGMAFSGTMSNFAGGFLILMSKPFKHGDLVETKGSLGRVDKISIFNTRIITPDNKVVYIPNSMISNDVITNHFTERMRRAEWKIGVTYGTPFQLMADTCREILRKDARLKEKKDGAPSDITVEILDLQDSSVLFVIRAWTTSRDCALFTLELMKEFYTKLPEAGVEFPFPQVDVHMKN